MVMPERGETQKPIRINMIKTNHHIDTSGIQELQDEEPQESER
jgi:hypothetical protein